MVVGLIPSFWVDCSSLSSSEYIQGFIKRISEDPSLSIGLYYYDLFFKADENVGPFPCFCIGSIDKHLGSRW